MKKRRPGEVHALVFLKGRIKEIVIASVIVLMISLFIRPAVISGSSMEPSFRDGDYLLVAKHMYLVSEPERGDVVIFPVEDEKRLYIKRIIGLPGDVITIKDGEVFVNGVRENADYAFGEKTPGSLENYTVPDGEIFVLGDNRENSVDSRQIGTQQIEEVKGTAVLRLWPVNRTNEVMIDVFQPI